MGWIFHIHVAYHNKEVKTMRNQVVDIGGQT